MAEFHYFIRINILIFAHTRSLKEQERKSSANTQIYQLLMLEDHAQRSNSALSVPALTLNDLILAKCVTSLMLFKCGVFHV